MYALLLAFVPGLLVGLSLGMTGSGGSLFAVPLLVLALGMSMSDAVPASMLIVGTASLLAVIVALKRKVVLLRPTLILGCISIATTPLGLYVGTLVVEEVRIGAFAVLAFAMCIYVWTQSDKPDMPLIQAEMNGYQQVPVCRFSPQGTLKFSIPCALVIAFIGAIIGVFSGFFGVGGGFLIVPALMYSIRMSVHQAVGSSLVIVALIGLTGGAFAGFSIVVSNHLVLTFAFGAIVGVLFGRTFASKIAQRLLQRIFAFALLCVCVFMVTKLL